MSEEIESEEFVRDKIGKMLIAGFEGYEVTPDSQAEQLIRLHRVHSFILGSKNFADAQQMKTLIQSLQDLARSERYDHPLLMAVDQELGCCNSMYDDEWLTQFPGAMGMAATNDLDLIFKIGEAVGQELKAIGFSLYMGPVLDIVPKMASQLIGIRSFGSSVEDVENYAGALARGLKKAGIATCAKHFPGMGTSFVDNLLELPMILENFQQLENFNILPFKHLMSEGLVDAVHASGVAVPNIAPNEIHACLSPKIINKLLRGECKFNGLVISECLELEALCRSIGLGQGAVMSILYARCDMAMVCNDYLYQKEALSSLKKAYDSGGYELIFAESLGRIDKVLSKLEWTPSIVMTPEILNIHRKLSARAYKASVTLIRDNQEALPLSRHFSKKHENKILLLTPLLSEIHPNAHHCLSKDDDSSLQKLLPGETVFREFGERLGNYRKDLNYEVLHTSYTANGLTSMHESLIAHCQAVILVCAEAARNMYQIGVAKHVSLLCGGYRKLNGFMKKPLIIIAATTPYDFLYHKGIGSTYLCTYDYTWNALSHVPAILFGDVKPTGKVPGNLNRVEYEADSNEEGGPKFQSGNSNRDNSNTNSLGMILNDSPLTNLISDAEDRKQVLFAMKEGDKSEVSSIGRSSPSPVLEASHHLRKRRKLKKPWLVEDFKLERDFTSLVLLLKNSGGSDLQENINPEILETLRRFLQENNGERGHHFVVRNSTINILHGAIFTWLDRDGMNGRILFVLVDKAKRKQSIAEALHEHAIKYLTILKGCKTITLGSTFPLFNFFSGLLCKEIAENWGSAYSPQTGKTKLSNSSLQILNFCRSTGWFTSRYPVSRVLPARKCILLLNLDKWMLSEKLVKQLKVLGIRFEIAKDYEEIIELIKRKSFKISDDEAHFAELYTAAADYIAQEGLKQLKNTIIFKMIDVNTKALIGSVILYNTNSMLADWYPYVKTISKGKVNPMSCLTGVFVDSSYETLKPVMKLGLICTGVSFVKQFRMQTVMLDNCEKSEIGELIDSGFELYSEYLSLLGIKMSYEWIVKLELYNSSIEASNAVGDSIAAKINAFHPTDSKPFVLGLPTGSSPLKVYARLIELYQQGIVDFSNVVSFNMDEYYNLPPTNPQSYHYFMYSNFFDHVNFKRGNINILNGMVENWQEECRRYEAKIKSYGKINFFLGGMGPEGHLAFNEAGSTRESITRRIFLVDSTVRANSRFFGGESEKVPKSALSVGISTILDNSDEVCIVVFGKAKNWALLQTLTKKPTSVIPSTFLKTHHNTTIVADYEAIEGGNCSKI
ncbi:hypothetical protein FOA43_001981 [Brettanomyces nanus]|uniref:glucosamine-6-phosphate deaminase n=1 Tax=Eeniella nana TaxID=13502 RepID=A0A875S4F4_EENNA|nr:uncharacterized protein FOA43_001981 [Brettanomyces nanus]QPG74649.1 hypothetical protein FOA43_001981 [Brettanomyces nanus]